MMNEKNESPFNNPRFLISIIVVFVFLWAWQFYITKKYPQPTNLSKEKLVQQENTSSQIETKNQTLKETPDLKNNLNSDVNLATDVEKTFNYEDQTIKWQISSYGMGFNYFELKEYKDKDRNTITYNTNEKLFAVHNENKIVNFNIQQISETEFLGKTTINGVNLTRRLKYDKEKKFFSSTLEFDKGLNQLSIFIYDKKHEIKNHTFLMPSFEIQDFLFTQNDKVHTEHISSLKDGENFNKTTTNVNLASINTQYFSQALLDKSDISPSLNILVKNNIASLEVSYDLKNSQVNKLNQMIFVGPKSNDILNNIDTTFSEVLDYGTFGFIAKPLLSLMKLLHNFLGNWGLAIIALTLVVRFIMLPFNIMSFKSSRAMQKIQPHLQAIREKYKNDPIQVNKETMALMKEHNANPISGCLPMLIQIPIFFALWKTIGSSIEIYQQPFMGWITDLSSHDKFFVLPILMGITMYFQQKLTPTTMDPAQQKILNFMPIIFGVFMLSLPSGLTLYNFVSALFGVTQQYFLLKDNSQKKLA